MKKGTPTCVLSFVILLVESEEDHWRKRMDQVLDETVVVAMSVPLETNEMEGKEEARAMEAATAIVPVRGRQGLRGRVDCTSPRRM